MRESYEPLFVYGTLKRGGENAFRFGDDVRFMGPCTLPGWRVEANGPTVVPAEDCTAVGELYLVPSANLRDIDLYEHPWKRQLAHIEDGREVWVYVAPGKGESGAGVSVNESLKTPRGAAKGKGVDCLTTTGTVIARGVDPAACAVGKPGDWLGDKWDSALAEALETLRAHKLKPRRELGRGSWGAVFVLDANRVLKLTADQTEAAAAARVLEAVADRETSWAKLPALARIQCVYAVLGACDRPTGLFALILERMAKPLTKEDAHYIGEVVDGTIVRMAKGLVTYNEPVIRSDAKDYDADGAESVRILRTVHELHRIGVPWHDLHGANVMVAADGHWKIVDIGYMHDEGTADMLVGALAREPLEQLVTVNEKLPTPGSVNEKLSTLGMAIIAADICIPDPIPGTPGPITAAVLAAEAASAGGHAREYAFLAPELITPVRRMLPHGRHPFLVAYERADGDRGMMDEHTLTRRNDEVRDILRDAHAHNDPLWDRCGDPTQRHWKLIALAYTPDPRKWAAWLHRLGVET
jgi:gamma-glutamylcyclotransferase (GGCT)/AIG2-like uncharacterized protein YtfP